MVELLSHKWGLAGRSEDQTSQLLLSLTELLQQRGGSKRNAGGLPLLADIIILNWDLGVEEGLHSWLLSFEIATVA